MPSATLTAQKDIEKITSILSLTWTQLNRHDVMRIGIWRGSIEYTCFALRLFYLGESTFRSDLMRSCVGPIAAIDVMVTRKLSALVRVGTEENLCSCQYRNPVREDRSKLLS
jgi:hypothetical protein